MSSSRKNFQETPYPLPAPRQRFTQVAYAPAEEPAGVAPMQPESRVVRSNDGRELQPMRLDDLRAGTPRIGLDAVALEAIRKDAVTAGYAEGWSEGYRAAAAEVRASAAEAEAAFAQTQQIFAQQISQALMALDNAARQLEMRVAEDFHAVEPELAEAAVALASSLLGRELQLTQSPVLDAVRRALDLAPSGRPVTVRLNPAEVDAVNEAMAVAQAHPSLARDIQLLPDPSVAEAGCIVECDATRIDAQLGTALDRVWEVLAS